MRPIVNGLQETYDNQITFIEVNAQDDGDGESAFKKLNLPGHPSFVIVQPDGEESSRVSGEQPLERLESMIENVLNG